MNAYWIIIEVNFGKPLSGEGIAKTVGFFQTFGCTERSDDTMKEMIQSFIMETEWIDDHEPIIDFDISVIDQNDIEREILMDEEINEHITSSPYNSGVWYQSGKAFFNNCDDDNQMYLVEVDPKDAH